MVTTTTFIDTTKLPRVKTPYGESTEVLNNAMVGAKNVLGEVHYLNAGEQYAAVPQDKHQLIYLMEGAGAIDLEGKTYDVPRGAGVYLGPNETAVIKAAAGTEVKLFHLTVPQIPK